MEVSPPSFSFIFKDIWPLRLTGGPVVKNLPVNGGGHEFDTRSRKIPHAVEQLSLSTTSTEIWEPRAYASQLEDPQ